MATSSILLAQKQTMATSFRLLEEKENGHLPPPLHREKEALATSMLFLSENKNEHLPPSLP